MPGTGAGTTPICRPRVTLVDLPADERCCPRCHLPYAEFPGTEDSETIEIHVRAHRRVIRRKRYRRTCSCPGVPGIITAPAPPRLFAKGIVGISVWVTVLLDKYQFYRPTHRLLEDLRTYGVDLPAGTLTDGLKRFLPLLEPIYAGILAESRRGMLWSADETRWMVFVQIEKKIGYRWYLWAFQSATAIAFELDPSRSHRVPDGHFQGVEGGILLVDRYAGYKAMELVKEGTILLGLLLGACAAGLRGRRQELAEVGPVGPGVAAGNPRSCTISTGNDFSAARIPPRLPRTTASCGMPSTPWLPSATNNWAARTCTLPAARPWRA